MDLLCASLGVPSAGSGLSLVFAFGVAFAFCFGVAFAFAFAFGVLPAFAFGVLVAAGFELEGACFFELVFRLGVLAFVVGASFPPWSLSDSDSVSSATGGSVPMASN